MYKRYIFSFFVVFQTIFDPHEWHESSYYDELAKAQKELMEKREKERKERLTKVDFVSGIVKKPVQQSSQVHPPPPLLLPPPAPLTQSQTQGN